MRDINDLDPSKYRFWWYKNDEDKYKRMVNDKEVYEYMNEMKCVVNLYVDLPVRSEVGVNMLNNMNKMMVELMLKNRNNMMLQIMLKKMHSVIVELKLKMNIMIKVMIVIMKLLV